MTTATMEKPSEIDLQPVVGKLTKDAKDAASSMTSKEARYLVSTYYQMQESRKRAANQVRALDADDEPNATITWLLGENEALEKRAKSLLALYARSKPIGRWASSCKGIGPVLSAGLMAHIDITKAAHVGHIYSFAGLNPNVKWEKGKKRPWNADLKVMCWKIGESFVKVCNHEDSIYGRLYIQRKEEEAIKNEEGDFASQAAAKLEACNIGKTTDAYKAYASGKLPPAHLHSRAKRFAVKIFLSHWHEAAYWLHYGKKAPDPYPFAHLGHADRIACPGISYA